MNFLENGGNVNGQRVLLSHSAGAPMDSPFMDFYADYLGNGGLRVYRFEFPYMQRRREEGGRRPPDRQPVLLECWKTAVTALGNPENLIIGGKSMGGRMASMVADEIGVKGLVCLGYPFYAAKKEDKPRIEHLVALKTPTLILQGSRDAMGNKDVVSKYNLSSTISIHWLEDGDHGFKPRIRSGRTEMQNWTEGTDKILDFTRALS
ncbi:dienelactone hydrolase family protein [Sneathiella marina]|uniref:Dienelactone hydrolase family protein n=1 Tax=Sneathiella marina TaxID=2950108 RepID=A0ABY4W0T3_9PROT|nr:alpha/beta family hydrolase [Sneathiella marina]USG60778.1 dienelactone hydrolase family protein [Sneathiella marina]